MNVGNIIKRYTPHSYSWYHSALTLSGWESSWKSLVSLKTSMGGAICTGENSDDILVGNLQDASRIFVSIVLVFEARFHFPSWH